MNLAIMRSGSGKLNRRALSQGGTWAKITFDRQIVAIAKVNRATTIYSDDKGLETFAQRLSIPVVKTWELPLPAAKQEVFPEMQEDIDEEG